MVHEIYTIDETEPINGRNDLLIHCSLILQKSSTKQNNAVISFFMGILLFFC